MDRLDGMDGRMDVGIEVLWVELVDVLWLEVLLQFHQIDFNTNKRYSTFLL
jgi:hypothetical protein